MVAVRGGEIQLEHLPGKDMMADLFTKQLQGQLLAHDKSLLGLGASRGEVIEIKNRTGAEPGGPERRQRV